MTCYASQDNERARMEYLNEVGGGLSDLRANGHPQIKRRAEEEKRYLEMELMRAQVSEPKAQLALS